MEKRTVEATKQAPLAKAEKTERLARAQANLDRLSQLEQKAA